MKKEQAIELANELMTKYLVTDWSFGIYLLIEKHGQIIPISKQINLNIETLARNDDFVIDTIKHEIAHAVVYESYERGEIVKYKVHGKEWKKVCKQIGCTPNAK